MTQNERLITKGLKPLERNDADNIQTVSIPSFTSFNQNTEHTAQSTDGTKVLENLYSKDRDWSAIKGSTAEDYGHTLPLREEVLTKQDYSNAEIISSRTGENADRLVGIPSYSDYFNSNTLTEEGSNFEPTLHPDILSSYYLGWNSLHPNSQKQLLEKYPKFQEMSDDRKSLALRRLIVDDLVTSDNSIPNKDQWAEYLRTSQDVTWDTLDTVFNSYYDQYNKKVAPKDARSYVGRLLDASLDAEEPIPAEGRYEDRVISSPKYRELEKAVETTKAKHATGVREQVAEQFNMLSDVDQSMKVDLLKNISSQVSRNYYDHFKETSKVQMSEEDWKDLYVDYMANTTAYGSDYANKILQDYWQNHVAANQGFWERAGKVTASTALIAASDIAMTGALILSPIDILITGLATGEWNNPLETTSMQYLELLQATGSFNPEKQQEYARYGINTLTSLNSVDQDYSYLDLNTFGEVLPQMGHIVGFSVGQAGATKALGYVAKGINKGVQTAAIASKSLKTLDKVNKVRKAQQTIESLATGSAFLASTATEATMEALSTKRNLLYQNEATYDQAVNDIMLRELGKIPANSPEFAKYVSLYRQLYPEDSIGTPVGNPEEGFRISYDDTDRIKVLRGLSQHPEFRAQFEKAWQPELANIVKAGQDAADAAFWTNFIIDMAIGSVTNGYLQQSMNAAPVRKLFRKKSPLATRLDELNLRLRNNHMDADVPPPSLSDNIKYQAKEIIGQGIEEYGQSIASTFSKAFGESMLNKYIEDRYKDGKIASAIDYDLGTAFSSGAEAAGEALTDRESIQSALYGVLTMGIGRPTFSVVDGKLKIGYENSFVNMFKPETNPEYQQRKELAQAVTEYFSNPKKLDSLLSAAANVAHTRDFQEAVARGDEKAIRDAQNAILLDAAAMVSQMDGIEAGQQILETLQKRAALSTSNLEDPESVENKVLQEFYKNPENKGIKEKDAIKSIAQSAKTTLDLISRSKEIAEEFPSLFGNLEDMDLQNAFVRHVLTLENREQRVKDIEAELKQHTARVSTKRSQLSTSAKEFLAEFGSAENASKTVAKMRKDLVSDIAKLKKQGANDKQIAAHRKSAVKEISTIEQRIDNYNSEVENIPANERIVTAADILELSPEYRGMFMSTKNRSQEQIARLSEFSNHAKDLMVDSGLNYAEAKSLEHAYKMFVSDPNHTARFFNNTKLAALRERASFKYEYLNRENISYEELFDEYNKAMRSASSDLDREAIFNTMLKTPHARRLLNEVTTANRERTALVGSEVWKSLDDSTKNKLDSVFKYMYDHHIPLDNSLSSDDLIDLVNSIPEEEFNGEMTLDETGKYDLKEVANLVEKLKGLLENRSKEKAEIEASTKEVVAEAPSNPSPSTAPVVVEEATPGPVENPVWELDKPYTLISDPDTTGFNTEVKEFLNEHSQRTVTPSTKIGKAVVFYTPTSLLSKGHNGSNPVVALLANEEGSITLGDRSYSALGIVASDTGFTVDRRDTTTGDIHYSDNAQISNVEAGGLTGTKEAKGTPIKDLSPNALNRIHKGKTKKGKPTLEIKVSRGKGKSGELALTVHTGRITEVEDKDGKTLDVTTKEAFESLETTTEAERLVFIHANPYTSLLHDILSRSSLFDRSNPEKYLEDKFFELFYFSNKAKANKNAFSVTKIKEERDSHDVLLNIGSSSFKLTTVNNGEWTARNTIEFLYNAMYSNGTLIKDPSTKQPALLYQVKYDSPTSVKRAFETGILRVYASSLEYQEPKITLRRVKESTVVETKPTDNATPISGSSSDSIVTPAGVEVPSDTGVNPQEDTETEGLLVDPNEIDTEDLFEYDLTTATREEKIAWLRDNHKAFLQAKWTPAKYNSEIKSLKERAKHFTTRNFTVEGQKSLENAKIEADIALREMNAKIKSDMIKSTEIVNIKNGYALKVQYYSLSEYIEAQASYFNSLSNKEINAILSNIKDGTDMLQSERLGSIVEGLTNSTLYKDYDAFLNSPINRQLNTLLKNLLESYGFTVISQDLSKVFKNDPLGAMSFAHKLVLLSSTKSTAMTLPEEFSHAMIRLAMLKSDNLDSVLNVNRLLEAIQDTAIYKDVYQQYKETYKTAEGEPDVARIAEEALGKALATAISKEYANSQDASFLGKVKTWFNKALNMFKTLANTVNHNWFKEAMLYNQLSKAANQLLNPEISTSESLDLNVTSEDIAKYAGITSTDKVEVKENPSREKARKALEAECTAINIPLKYLAPEIREELSKIGITEEQWYKIPRALQETIIKCRVRY